MKVIAVYLAIGFVISLLYTLLSVDPQDDPMPVEVFLWILAWPIMVPMSIVYGLIVVLHRFFSRY